jgi:capsular exopolysaccharide synthesis family protein
MVSASLSFAGQGETSIIDVSATSTSAALAAAIANTYTTQFVTEQQRGNRQFLKSALALVAKQLARLTPAQRFGTDGADLEDRAQTLALLTELGFKNVEVAQEALVPTSVSSPKTKKNTILGAVVGLLLGLGIAFTLERLDRRIREPEDLETIYRLPTLGVVPKLPTRSRSAGPDQRSGTPLPPAVAEAFSLIRAHLRFFNVDRDVRTIVIGSPAPGDGKSTIARHLAEAATSSGSRVLLIEADLRQPTLAQKLDIEVGPGLADVLIGAVSMADAIQSVKLTAPAGEVAGGRGLDVLVAGAVPPPNPGELLESGAMATVLARSKAIYDLVVIDTPPLGAVSDAFPLLTKVDGVVIVGRLGFSRRDAAVQLHQILVSSAAPLLGVISNGSSAGAPTPYPGVGTKSRTASADSTSSSPEEFVPAAKA